MCSNGVDGERQSDAPVPEGVVAPQAAAVVKASHFIGFRVAGVASEEVADALVRAQVS